MTNKRFSGAGSDHLDLLLATTEIGVWELDVDTGTAVRNRRHDKIFGHDSMLDTWSADIFLSYVLDEDRARVQALLEQALEEGSTWSFETRICRADGTIRWISANGMPKFNEAGEVEKLIGHVIDISDIKENEDRLKLLSKELDHRVMNTFTIMHAMIRHARRTAASVDELADTLLERLGALARANRILVAAETHRSSLRDILRTELDAFGGWHSRIAVTGQGEMWFSGEASEALALIFHELLTNAVKHGALSVPDGRISLEVAADENGGVRITWTESGGPEVQGAQRIGIGSSILRNALRDEGKVELDFAPEGLICTIQVDHGVKREPSDDYVSKPLETPAPYSLAEDSSLAGRTIMIVEDDPIIGMDIEDMLRSRGADVLGPFATVARALEAVPNSPDAALLDINLGRERTDGVATRLSELSIPFLVLSGQIDGAQLGTAFEGVPVVGKPFSENELVGCVLDLMR